MNTSRYNLHYIAWLIVVFSVLGTVWLSAFPFTTKLDVLDIALESAYFLAIFIAFIYALYLRVTLLSLGLAVLACGLFIDVLDEFTKEPGLWDTLVQGLIEITGAILFAFSLFRSHHQLRQELQQSHAMIKVHRHMALHDALTGIPNRILLMERLQQAIEQATQLNSRIAVLYIDLNGFKQVNDHYGHDTGDELLKAIAMRIHKKIRVEDTLARIGGDEFIVVMNDVAHRAQAEAMQQKLYTCLAAPFSINEQHISAGSTIGIAIYPDDASTARQLLKQADESMYESKLAG